MKNRVNLANRITLGRILLIPFFIMAFLYAPLVEGLGLLSLFFFLLVSILDAVDGIVARVRQEKTELGAFLDPLADRLLVLAGLILLIRRGLPVWVTVSVVSRDVVIFGGYLVLGFLGRPHTIRPTLWGKATTAFEFIMIAVSLFLLFVMDKTSLAREEFIIYGMAPVMVMMAVISGLQYFMIGLRRLEE